MAECLRDPRKKGASPDSVSGLFPVFTQSSNGGEHDTGEGGELKRGCGLIKERIDHWLLVVCDWSLKGQDAWLVAEYPILSAISLASNDSN